MTLNQKTLIQSAMKKHPGKLLTFCGDKTNWNDCFTVEELDGGERLVFWYNLPNGATDNESMLIENECVLKIDGKFITVDDTGWPVFDEELCGRTTRFTKASGEEYRNNLIKNKLFGKYELVLIGEI